MTVDEFKLPVLCTGGYLMKLRNILSILKNKTVIYRIVCMYIFIHIFAPYGCRSGCMLMYIYISNQCLYE